MSESPIARRYAKALVELCAESKNQAIIGKQLQSFAATYDGSPELQNVLKSPVISDADKREILAKLFSRYLFAPTTRNFLLVLLDAGRLDAVGAVSSAFDHQLDLEANRLRATVTSAVPMERSDLSRIQAALARLTNKTIVLDAKVDPSLIGGVVTEIGNIVLDGSIKTQLAGMGEALAR